MQSRIVATAGSPSTAAGVPAYLQPIFRALDTLLTPGQRDTLRAMTLDSAFIYRAHRLAPSVERMSAEWSRSPAGDTLVAHGEPLPGVMVAILLDLYQQHLRGAPINLAGALRRMSPEYVSAYGARVSVDSVLLERDLDDSGRRDRLVREVRKKVLDEDVQVVDYRVALYLDRSVSEPRSPAWAIDWSEFGGGALSRTLAPASGGSLLVVALEHADAAERIVLHARRGEVRDVLRHQIDYGEGSFSIRQEDQRIVVEATKDVQVEGRRLSPQIQCPPGQWPGSTLSFDAMERRFVVERSICVPRR